MDELQEFVDRQAGQLLFDEVLNRFYVMIRWCFDGFNAQRIGFGQVLVQSPQRRKQRMVDGLKLGQRPLAKGNKVLYFNLYAVTD